MPNFGATGAFTESHGCNMPYRAGKVSLFEGGVRGAAFITGPMIPENLKGTTSDNMFHAFDWLPTMVEMAGGTLDPKIDFDGGNMYEALIGNEDWNRTTLYINLGLDVIHQGIASSFSFVPSHIPCFPYPSENVPSASIALSLSFSLSLSRQTLVYVPCEKYFLATLNVCFFCATQE